MRLPFCSSLSSTTARAEPLLSSPLLRFFHQDRDLKLATHAVFVTLLAHSTPVFLLNTVADSLRNRTASEAANGGQGLVFGLLALGLCCKLLAPQIIEDVLPALQDILLPVRPSPLLLSPSASSSLTRRRTSSLLPSNRKGSQRTQRR